MLCSILQALYLSRVTPQIQRAITMAIIKLGNIASRTFPRLPPLNGRIDRRTELQSRSIPRETGYNKGV